jgi:hypothetical protein
MTVARVLSFFLCLAVLGCSSRHGSGLGSSDFEIKLDSVFINHYKSDSLNKIRPYVIPRIYFVFGFDNSSPDSVLVILNEYFGESEEDTPYFYAVFEYGSIRDTLMLSDYENVNPIIIAPNTRDIFVVGAPVSKYMEMDIYKTETPATLMKYIANNSQVMYRSPKPEDQRILGSQTIKKSKHFRVIFRDPVDTTVE